MVRDKDSSAIHVGLTVSNALNCAAWIGIGYAKLDYFMMASIGPALLFNLVSLGLCCTYGREAEKKAKEQWVGGNDEKTNTTVEDLDLEAGGGGGGFRKMDSIVPVSQ